MSQRVPNIQAVSVNADVDPAQTGGLGGISGIEDGSTRSIVLRVEVDGPSGVNLIVPPVTVTPTFTVT